MRIRGAIVAWALAGTLGAAWWFTSPRDVGSAAAVVTPEFEQDKVSTIRVTFPSGAIAEVRRVSTPAGPAWVTDWSGVSWPASNATVRAVLRAVRTAEILPAENVALGESPTTIELLGENGEAWALRLGDRPLAGRVDAAFGAEGATSTGRVSADLWSIFREAAVRSWREARAFDWEVGMPSRIRLESGANAVSLSRGGGRWVVTSPVAAPADEQAVQRLLATLGAVRATAVSEAGDESGTPLAVVVVETDRPGVDGQRVTLTREARITGGADLGAGLVDVRTEQSWEGGPAFGPVVLSVPAAQLQEIAVSAGAYVSRVAMDVSGLMRVEIGIGEDVARIRRSGEGWTPEGETLPADGEKLAAILGLVSQPAIAVDAVVGTEPEGARVVLSAREPVATAFVRVLDGGVRVRIGDVEWVYAREASAGLVEWLSRP